MGKSNRLFNPFISLNLSNRKYWATRDQEKEFRTITFDGSFVDPVFANSEQLIGGSVMIMEGHLQHEGMDVLGAVDYLEAWSTEEFHKPIGELLRLRAQHIMEHGASVPFPDAGFIEPARVSIRIFVDTLTFESIRTADMESFRIALNFQCNAENDSTFRRSGNVTSWDVSKEKSVLAETFNIGIDPNEKKAQAQVDRSSDGKTLILNQSLMLFEKEVLVRMESIEKKLLWCFCGLVAILVWLFLKKA